ncbi:MAG TPA: hypothetical protein V6C86_21075 [Oculatellaceae cyanobacterium]
MLIPAATMESMESMESCWSDQDIEDFISAHGLGLQLWVNFYKFFAVENEKVESMESYLIDIESRLEQTWRRKLMNAFGERFFNRTDFYYVQRVGEDGKCQYFKKREGDKDFNPINTALSRHLLGYQTLSLPALSSDGFCKWACWDSDVESGELLKIKDGLERLGLHPYRESVREGRDGHLWLFFSRPVSASDLIDFNSELIRQLNIDCAGIEFFPKSATKESQIRAPLGIHKKDGYNKRGYFQGVPEGEGYWFDAQMVFIAELHTDNPSVLESIAATVRKSMKPVIPQVKRVTENYDKEERPLITEIVKVNQKSDSRDFIAACPSCVLRGEDRHEDNLRISKADPKLFNCVSGGPGNGCTTEEIWTALGH